MEVKLTIQGGTSQKRVFRMTRPVLLIGRTKGCGLKIPSASVSRHHCRLTVVEGIVYIRDLGSSNGTFVNDRSIVSEALRPGDLLRVGPITFKVEYPLTPQAVERLLRDGPHASAPPDREEEQLPEAIPLDDSQAALPVPEEFSLDEAPIRMREEISETPTLPEEAPAKPKKKKKRKKPEHSAPESVSPDYSIMMKEEGGWQAPSGENLRDLLARLEDEE